MAKSAKSTNVQVNLSLSIPKEDHEVFESVAQESVEEYLNTCVANYLSAYAKGGLMLSEDDIEEIGAVIGEEVTSSDDIVNAIRHGSVPEDDESTLKISIDPSLNANIKESADVLGITKEQWVQNCWGHILANGWLYGISGDIRWIPFELNKIIEIEKTYGKPLDSSTNICEALTAQMGVK